MPEITTSDLIIDELLRDRSPITYIEMPLLIGVAFIVKNSKGENSYQAQLSEAKPTGFDQISSVIIKSKNSGIKVAVKNDGGTSTFSFETTEDLATKEILRNMCEVFAVKRFALHKPANWSPQQNIRYSQAELAYNEYVRKSNPLNIIVDTLTVIDYSVELWRKFAEGIEPLPETDNFGETLTEAKAEETYQTWLRWQAMVGAIAQEAVNMKLTNPISAESRAWHLRSCQIGFIAAALDMDNVGSRGLSTLSGDTIGNTWQAILGLLGEAQIPKDQADAEPPVSDEEKKPEAAKPPVKNRSAKSTAGEKW